MSMDKKLTSAVYAAVEKAYDHRCDIEDAADEILEIIEADRKRRGEPVAWAAADTLNFPHPTCISSLAYMSQIDRERGREYVPLYTSPVAAQAQQDADKADAERYRAWRDALITGKTAEEDFIRLVADNLPTSVGVSRRPTAAEWDAAIDAARKEPAP